MTSWTLIGRENGEKSRWRVDAPEDWSWASVLAHGRQQLPQVRPLLLVIPGGKP